MINKKILCVDDEPHVLDAFSRSLRKDFEVLVAESGERALGVIDSQGPFAVVLSDMRMPGMNGVEFLERVKTKAPETVRVMLTGNADQQTASDAVNKGCIFRFLTKPCPPEDLTSTLLAAVEQYRLTTVERHLLEQTLNKSLEVLVDILAIVNPTAFSRSTRVKKMAREIAERLKMDNPWEVEIAAMLSQIGCITVPEEILQKVAQRTPLSNKETGLYHQHPQIGHDLIARIPRMEAVADIVANQKLRICDEPSGAPGPGAKILGARILKAVLDFDRLILAGMTPLHANRELSAREGWYDPRVLEALQTVAHVSHGDYETCELRIEELKPGMLLDGPLMSTRGSVLLPDAQEITMSLILRLGNLFEAGIINNKVLVNVPVSQTASAVTEQPQQPPWLPGSDSAPQYRVNL